MTFLQVVFWFSTSLALLMCLSCNKATEKAGESASEEINGTATADVVDSELGEDEAGTGVLSVDEVDLDLEEVEVPVWAEPVQTTSTPVIVPSMPRSWPKAFPPYPDSTISDSYSTSKNGKLKMGVTLVTDDPIGRVVRFYTEQAKTGGFKTNASRDSGKFRIRHYVSKKFTVDLNIVQNTKTVTITMTTRSKEDF